MSRRPARVTEADIARALRAAARQSRPHAVEVLPDGTIRVVPTQDRPNGQLAELKEIVL